MFPNGPRLTAAEPAATLPLDSFRVVETTRAEGAEHILSRELSSLREDTN